MHNPLVSVIIPSYNHESYIRESVESVINQTYQNIQLIVIDDGSKDGSPELIQELAERYGFTYELQQNIGLAATLNKAIRKYVKGSYLRLIASDDKLTPDSVKIQVACLERNPECALCYGNAFKMDMDSKVVGKILGTKPVGIKNYYQAYALNKIVFNITTCLYRTRAIREVGLYDENRFCEDIYMNRLILRNYPAGYVDAFVSYYRIYGGNSTTNHWLMYQESKSLLELDVDEPFYPELYDRRALQWFYSLSRKHKAEALKYFWPASKKFYSKFFLAGCLNLIGLGMIEKLLYHRS